MNTMEEIRHARSRILGEARDTLMHPTHRPMRTGGILLLILGIFGFLWIWPELRRYIRMERM